MDLEQKLWELIDAIDRGDRIQTDELLKIIQAWNRVGGTLPRMTRTLGGRFLVRSYSVPPSNSGTLGERSHG